jgi:L-lactate dehydrogenase (cytochrome)
MIPVLKVKTGTRLLGTETAAPFYISATALGKLGHPEGEVVLTRACGNRNIIQMMPTLASCSLDDMMNAALPNQKQWYQVYVNQDRQMTQKLIQHAERRGATAIVITVDAPALGRREKDMRMKFMDDAPDVQVKNAMNRSQGASRALSSFIDPNLCWNDIPWFQSITRLPIVLKGIQTGDDALLAAQFGVQGIIVSNHGGRQLDTVRSGIEILPEVIECLTKVGQRQKLQVFVDGGFRRGGDIYKALALVIIRISDIVGRRCCGIRPSYSICHVILWASRSRALSRFTQGGIGNGDEINGNT